MPIRNLGPCACCRARYATGFRIVEIGGYFAGSSAGIGMHVEYEPLGDVVFRVEFSDGTFETQAFVASSCVSNSTEPSRTTLSGTFEYDGERYEWSMYWGWGTYGSASIYKPVADCDEWFAAGRHWNGETLIGDSFSDIFWSF